MSKLLIKCVFLIVWFTHFDCEIYQDRPKIRTSDGDLILEPAFDKNIYLRSNGPKSNIFIGEVNILKIDTAKSGIQYLPSTDDDFDKNRNGVGDILKRLERLENRNSPLTDDLLFNISRLWRKVNNLNRKVLNLQVQINSRGRDECQSQPCQHGGSCLNLVNGYHCLCPSNWEGRDCDIDVNECRNFAGTDLGCQNGATCINRPGSYECLCRSNWYGLHCTRKEKDCFGGDFEMCGHGTCITVKTGLGVNCICHQGWTTNGTGIACLTDVNECDAHLGPRCSMNPKVECINLPGSFRCGQCPPGYDGDGYSCSDIDECVTIPNGGCSPMVVCHNTVGSRICGPCPPGYQGDGVTCSWRGSCSINHGGCHPSAQCIENILGGAGSQCVCPDGMEGDGVGLQGCFVTTGGNFTQGCESNPCGAHGQCHPLRTGYTCICFKGYSGAHCDISTNLCAINPCFNGGICRPDDTITRGFRCECTAQYSGPLCQMLSKTCGGVLDNEEGSIVYPLSNASYSNNARCAWVIHTVPDKVINVTFTKFNLEVSPECLYDFLQIHDGRSSASQFIGRFCGNNFPKGGNIISSHNNLYFWFRSDGTVAKDGFALHWTSINPVCGGEVNATTHGHISSPGSPGKYPPNRDCYWHLTTTLGKRIQLHFFAFDIEVHANCSFDFLAIYDGEHMTDPLLSKFCNSTQPAPVVSAGSDIMIHFHSDAYGSGNGFQIAYAPVEGIPGCGGYFTVDNGEIVSPSLNGKYLNNILCEYKIKTTPDTKIRIEFKSFKLESSLRCKYDYLKIYDGPSSESRLIGRFCGSSYPKSYISSTNMLFFKFKTDHSVSSDGFKITYEAICQITVLGDSGVIKSPGYPFSYPENRVCEYVITAAPGKIIQLTFQDFDIEDNTYNNCQYDHVEIRDGPDVNSTLLGTYCGGSEHIPPVQTSSHNYMYVKFNSDLSISGTGFYANYTTIDAECGGIYRTTTGLINHPQEDSTTYKNGQSCSWILIAPEGMHIKLSWNRFNIENMPNCVSDYLELIEIDENNQNNTLGTFCGVNAPPALTTSTNRLMMKFQSDSSVRSAGFSVSYTFLDDKSHCGGTFIRTHGFIYSPGWPKSYEPNRDCTWTITVPVGQQIRLNISQFDLERPIRDKCNLGDYLEIRNGASQNAPLISQLCGNFRSRRIVSMANVLYLRFHSDFYLTGKGFKIEWDGTITGCGGTLTSSTGSISSPNYPNNYNENAECFYKIVTSPGSRIRISFTDLELERTRRCRDDYVEIYDGRDANAPQLGKHCFMSPALSNIETSANYAFIKFRSDFYIGGKGFLLSYSTICRNNVTGRYGVIESPDYPGNYPLHLDCLWTINVLKGNKINVTFTHFDLFKPYRRHRNWWSQRRPLTCDEDYIQTKELSDTSYSTHLCGNTPPSLLSTKGNSFQIKFVTGYVPRTGFRLEWISYGCGGHIQKNFGTITLDRSSTSSGEMECEWIIETYTGQSVYITFTDLYMTEDKNCTTDAIEIYNGPDVKSPLLTKVCHRDKISVQSSANFMLVRFVKRSSLKDVYFQSHFYSPKSSCGGNVEALSGYIYSKNYPKNYEDNLDCVWIISVPNNHRIELNFMDIDLYSTSDYDDDEESACGDLIRIYDNLDSNYTHRICPKSNASQIISTTNRIQVQFITNNYGTAKGFKANFTTICGSVITALYDGTITNDLNNHTNSCTWTILASNPSQKISLTITHMSLQNNYGVATNKSCSSSFLRVFDGNNKEAPLVNEFCGRKVPPMIVSHGSAITIELGTNSGYIAGKFSAHYSPLSNACGGTLTSEEGTIASPNYPRPYPADANCEWILSTSPGNRVYITFERFNLEYSDGCNDDYLEVRENDGGGRILGVYCGDDIPINTTTAAKIYIKFHSNNQNNGEGFLIHYGFLHGNEITGESGVVASPLYPYPYHGSGEYSWRITTSASKTISLIINNLEIHSYSGTCYNKLSIYDGYDDSAPLIEDLCGILAPDLKVLQTTSNAVYIKLLMDVSNTGSMFRITWANADRSTGDVDSAEKINCGSNKTELVSAGYSKIFESPNYPEDYGYMLHCVWLFKSSVGNHLNLRFNDFQIEDTNGCFADSVSIFSADTPSRWKPIKENVCSSESVSGEIKSSRYLKVEFKTDTSVTRKGFQARVSAICGGVVSDSSGTISPTWLDTHVPGTFMPRTRCNWTVKVRPGRVIKLQFEHFNISNSNDECTTAVILHNGDSVEAPMIASGKYCGYPHENREEIITSSNALFISYISDNVKGAYAFQNFRIRYEEKNIECGVTSKLDSDHRWEVISSPNYPAVPLPYSECVWVFSGPPGEIIRIDFIDRFDLDDVDDCATEVVEIRDGSSELSPRLGRYCSERPGTVKTRSNIAHIKYLTQLAEPRNGFKANVSIDICGGTIVSSSGEVLSPNYPHLQVLPYGTICEWRIIGSPTNVFLIKPQDINLPDSESSCETKIIIEELIPANNTIAILKTFCNDDIDDTFPTIETSTNEFMIKFYIGKPGEWTQMSEHRGFRITYNSSRPICGGLITTPEGYLTTPSYPLETTLRYCQWLIKVPNKARKVRLELMDTDTQKHRIGIFNDLTFQSAIQRIPEDGDLTPTTHIFESSGNKLAIYLWLNPLSTRHRFKAKFSSDEPALCGGDLNGLGGQLVSPDVERSYTCEWHYNNKDSAPGDNLDYSTLYVTAKVNSSVTRTRCRYFDPKLNIKSTIQEKGLVFNRDICGKTDVSFRIPSSVMNLRATKSKVNSLYFHLEWKSQPCGGIIHIVESPQNILKVPNVYNNSLDCAWVLLVPINNRIELKMEGSFKLECDKEFLKVSQGLTQNSPVIGDFCKNKMLDNPIIANFRFIYIQYHSIAKNNTDIKLMAKTVTDQCGGTLFSYENTFASPNYPKNYLANQECAWEIKADWGNRISLQFIERFVVENRPNCTKDVVIVYDWKDNTYTEIARLCGRELPTSYKSTLNRMKVVLRTDADTNLDGFKAQWTPICGGQYTATEKEQILYSPGFPYQYQPLLNCSYEISAPDKRVILVEFLEFELEGTYPDCIYDNLTVTGESTYDYNYQVYCGSELPSSLRFDKISLIFKTDKYIQRKGFKLSYKVYTCGGHVNSSTVLSSNTLETYHENMNCTWFIEAPHSMVVVLKFIYIDLEDNNECYNDYISVYNGLTIDSGKRLALMCGNVNSTTVLRSNGNTMLLQFVSDHNINLKGFKVDVFFSYSESVGCGGQIDMTKVTTRTFKSPLIYWNVLYENYLDCQWMIKSPIDTYIKIEFTSFHISPCKDVNQTALGFSKCDCDLVEVKDGINPNSLQIGTYCGHTLPPQLISSKNTMSIRLSTDGAITSSGFEARLVVQQSLCGQSFYTVTDKVQRLQSPGYETGTIPRGLHCAYHFDADLYTVIRLTISVDLRPASTEDGKATHCVKDRLLIASSPHKLNTTLGHDFIMHSESNDFFSRSNFYDQILPARFELCGVKQSLDFYVTGRISINLITSADSDTLKYKGVQIEMVYAGFCGRNYTETQGRIQTPYTNPSETNADNDCYTLISAPENHTISIYFLNVIPDYWNENCYLDVYDGNKTSAPKLIRIHTEYENNYPVFSTGRYILLNNHRSDNTQSEGRLTYDLIYVTTDKGRGCGGKLMNEIGKVTSPFYPNNYRQKSTCEWELETPSNTRLFLTFTVFDLGINCDQNYVQLVDSKGNVISTFCSETPADYTSNDNFVKIIFVTTVNNGGTGWVAEFIGIMT